MIRTPTQSELAQVDAECAQLGPGLADNWRFWRLFNYTDGLIAREIPVYKKNAAGRLAKTHIDARTTLIEQVGTRRSFMRRRQFLERMLLIRGKDTLLSPLRLNRTQRIREARILRQERLGLPVRRVDLKGRQFGFTTHSIGICVDAFLRGAREKALVVSQDNETASAALDMSRVMLEELPRARGRWNFAMNAEQVAIKQLAEPQNSQMSIASAKKDNPGRGLTFSIGAFDEAAFWEEAERKATSLMKALPKVAGSMGLVFSTANGRGGWFYDLFWAAYEQRHVPLVERTTMWDAGFFPWFIHDEYRISITQNQRQQLEHTLTSHEKWLLEQSYFRRWSENDTWEQYEKTGEGGNPVKVWRRRECGWRHVDLEQLAWRRRELQDHNADPLRPDTWAAFQAEFPATAEEAFAATGRLAFDPQAVADLYSKTEEPSFKGDILEVGELEKARESGIPFFARPKYEGDAPKAREAAAPGVFARARNALEKLRTEVVDAE